jgi:hypothetical protein
MRYVMGLLRGIPMLAPLIERETAESVDLKRSVSIEIMTASFRTIRGYSIPVALVDEIAFFPADDSANPDSEILAALRPAMATFPSPLLLLASSPYARRGELWRVYKDHHGRDDAPTLCWQAPTRTMNPSVPQSVIDEAMERDSASASAEFLAQFRSDVERLFTLESVETCVSPGVFERAPVSGVEYIAHCDPSGGVADSMTLCIGSRENDVAVVDCIRERIPPFSPDEVVREFAEVLKSYRVATVYGDRYAGEWPRERFRVHGIEYKVAEKNRSELYGALLPAVNSRTVDLLDNKRLTAQLVGLERRTARSGRDSIDHAPGAHDDIAVSVAGFADLALNRRSIEDDIICFPRIHRGLDDSPHLWSGPSGTGVAPPSYSSWMFRGEE